MGKKRGLTRWTPDQTRYLNQFLGIRGLDGLARYFRGANNAAKEVSESMAALWAVKRHIGDERLFGRPDVVCLVPGDGVQPRTGALMALRTHWQVVSIDPLMRARDGLPSRLAVYRGTTGDWIRDGGPDWLEGASLQVVLAVHSHAPLAELVRALPPGPKLVVAIPCCVAQTCDLDQVADYQDAGIASPANHVIVWSSTI